MPETVNRIFTPEDEPTYQEIPEEPGHKQELPRPVLSQERINEIREEAVKRALSPDAKSNGKPITDVLPWLNRWHYDNQKTLRR